MPQIVKGRCSWFGGPEDMGVSPSEGLAFIYEYDMAPGLFLPQQPPGTTGLARRLNPDLGKTGCGYIAMRWDYDAPGQSKEELLKLLVLVRNPKNGKTAVAKPSDWGPAGPESDHDTGRVADLSPGLFEKLELTTDDEVEVLIPEPRPPWRHEDAPTNDRPSVVLSPGHGLLIRGAAGPKPYGLDEVDTARKLVPIIAGYLRERGCVATEVKDDVSTDQPSNLEYLCAAHNTQPAHDYDISIHLNCYDTTAQGVECFYYSQSELATRIAENIVDASGMTLREPGGKYSSNLYFLNHTNAKSALVEIGFCDHEGDCSKMTKYLNQIGMAIADAIVGDSYIE